MDWTRACRFAYAVCVALLLCGCGIVPKVSPPSGEENRTRKLAVFIDGTAQDERGETSIKRLHSLITFQDRSDIAAIYIEGVGAKGKPLGLASGFGTAERVRHAYAFLLEHYRHDNPQEIHLFGFSRGGYAIRILATLLEYAGLPDYRPSGPEGRPEYMYIAEETYKEVFRDPSAAWMWSRTPPWERTEEISKSLRSLGARAGTFGRVDITAMGLFDTVDEVGVPGIDGSVADLNPRFWGQLCNVRRAYHAVSLDDNREKVFAPKLITRPQLFARCPERLEKLDEFVHEVWFSGAHTDVGGGYHDSLLGGIPLNWMLRKMARFDLFPAGIRVRENHLDVGRDAEESTIPWLYPRGHRKLITYLDPQSAIHNPGGAQLPPAASVIRVHQSVFDRLKDCAVRKCAQLAQMPFSSPVKVWRPGQADYEFRWTYDWDPKGCFAVSGADSGPPQVFMADPRSCGRIIVDEPEWNSPTKEARQIYAPTASKRAAAQ